MDWLHSTHFGMSEQKTHRAITDCSIPLRRGPAIMCASSHSLLLEHFMFFLLCLLCNQSIVEIIKPPTVPVSKFSLFFPVKKPYFGFVATGSKHGRGHRGENSLNPHTKDHLNLRFSYVITAIVPTGSCTSSSNFSVGARSNIPSATVYWEIYSCKWNTLLPVPEY